jgi:hypothetical protein
MCATDTLDPLWEITWNCICRAVVGEQLSTCGRDTLYIACSGEGLHNPGRLVASFLSGALAAVVGLALTLTLNTHNGWFTWLQLTINLMKLGYDQTCILRRERELSTLYVFELFLLESSLL